ncbi:MAG: hypothetical protein ABIG61_15450 [Planctomycetota bacterium]
MTCVKCGKNMTDEDGGTTIGISLELTVEPGQPDAFLKMQLGKYEVNKRYEFCWECWLDSLFNNEPTGRILK